MHKHRQLSRRRRHILAAEMPDLEAIPSVVRIPRRTSALDFVHLQSLYKSLDPAVYSPQAPFKPVRFAVSHHCPVQHPDYVCAAGACKRGGKAASV